MAKKVIVSWRILWNNHQRAEKNEESKLVYVLLLLLLLLFWLFLLETLMVMFLTDEPTDGPTNSWTDRQSFL